MLWNQKINFWVFINFICNTPVNVPRGKESTEVQKSQIKGKEKGK